VGTSVGVSSEGLEMATTRSRELGAAMKAWGDRIKRLEIRS
jgi:hypothetical protein